MEDPIATLVEYLKFPSISDDPAYKDGVLGAHDFLVGQFESMGFEVESVKTDLHPIVLAKRGGDPSWPHVLLYGHYDVQPVDPIELWDSDPFEPVIKDGKVYARGAADNKGPFMAELAGVAQLLKEVPDLPLRITFLVEGEEEMGSPSFPKFLEDYKDLLSEADCMFISDTTNPSTENAAIVNGMRGIVELEVTVKGPSADLHSGLFGGAVLNPIQALMQMGASLHTPDGHVHVNGFYDDVVAPEAWEREELERYPLTEAEFQHQAGVPKFNAPMGFKPLEGVRFSPTLEFNGVGGGYQGEGGKTVIPTHAFAKITCRLVPNQDPDTIMKLVKDALIERAPEGVLVDVKLGQGGAPYCVVPPNRPNTPEDQNPVLAKAFTLAEEAIEGVFGKPPVYVREGGSIPIVANIKETTGLDCVMFGLATNTDKIHSPNEHFHLVMLERGIEYYKRVLKGLAGV